MSFSGPNINKRQGGLNRSNPSTDGVFLMIYALAIADVPSGLAHNEPILITQIEDAENAGIDAALDANKNILAHQQLAEFFRLAPESKIYFMFTPVATPVVMLGNAAVQTAIRSLASIKGIGILGTGDTLATLPAQLEAVQEELDTFARDKKLIDFVILQGNAAPTAMAVSAYPDLRGYAAPNVSVSIAQDPEVAAIDTAYADYADVGSVLAGLAVRAVNENLGSVDIKSKPRNRRGEENYSITGVESWRKCGLSDAKTFASLSATDQKTLTDKGYIYAGQFEGYDGIYFNNAPTAVELASDYAFIENNRTWNKVARAVRNRLIPSIRTTLKKDPATGYLRATSVAALEAQVDKAVSPILNADEISGFEAYIDPKQIVDDAHPLNVKINVVKDDILHEMDIDLGYSATL